MTVSPSKLLVLIAVVLFVLAALGATLGSLGELDVVSIALAFGFASFLV